MVKIVIESFPILSDASELVVDDFSRFSSSYAGILQNYFPAAKQVVFAFSAGQMQSLYRGSSCVDELSSLFTKLKEGEVTHAIYSRFLLLAFDLKDGDKIVAIISGADPLFLKRVGDDWLLEITETVERQFLLLKQARVDGQTGLLNISNLYSLLETYGSREGMHLILLELTPKRTSFQYSLRYSHKCANLLLNFVQADSVLHYLGQSTFALVLQKSYEGQRPEIESALVTYLKREGCHRVHIGSSFSRDLSENENQSCHGRQLLDEAWTALCHAAKRGPFSFCDFSLLAHPENHPLAPPDRNLVRRLSRLWSKSGNFCLVQFRSDNDTYTASRVVPVNINQGVVLLSGDDVFVYLDGVKACEALEWSKEVIRRTVEPEKNIHVSAGVSSYPYCDFKKTEMVFNCRKALLHAAFYGNSSAAVFDPVSLNISGDIYFGDGDLAKAVKEYKRGLKCESRDINLHNSLGVALAMMDKLSPAMLSFENGLALDGDNFMALYNLGLGEQTRNRKPEALEYLEKALQHSSHEEGGAEFVKDLTMQLGILSCEIGKYEAALSYLVPWQREHKNVQSAGRVYYYLGQAYYGLKKNRKAMEALQRALRFNEFDDRAMSLLGRLYLEEGEGDQIALSLCRKSVELEPSKRTYMLYLAEVLLRCGSSHEARKFLYRCLRNRECKNEAQLLLAESYAYEGQQQRAKGWFGKALAQEDCRPNLKVRAELGLKKLSQK
jgi:tetratricopeptide (TPR) repeat protein